MRQNMREATLRSETADHFGRSGMSGPEASGRQIERLPARLDPLVEALGRAVARQVMRHEHASHPQP